MRFQAPESLSEQIAQHVGQRIVTGALRPGERIQELKVAGELDVSRGSVREALLILERRHLIHIFPRRGASVAALTPDLVNSLFDTCVPLLILLGQKVIKRCEAADLGAIIRQLKLLENRLAKSGDETAEVIEGSFELMRLCYSVVGNPYLTETLENLRPAISRTYHLAMRSDRERAGYSQKFFHDLLSTAQQGDDAGIAEAIRNYAAHQRDIVLQALAAESPIY